MHDVRAGVLVNLSNFVLDQLLSYNQLLMLFLTLFKHFSILAYYWLVLELKLVYGKVHLLQSFTILDATIIRDPLTLAWLPRELHVWGWRSRLELQALDADFECDEGARVSILITHKDLMLQCVVHSILTGDHHFFQFDLSIDVWR